MRLAKSARKKAIQANSESEMCFPLRRHVDDLSVDQLVSAAFEKARFLHAQHLFAGETVAGGRGWGRSNPDVHGRMLAHVEQRLDREAQA